VETCLEKMTRMDGAGRTTIGILMNWALCIWLLAGGFCHDGEESHDITWHTRLIGPGIYMMFGEGEPMYHDLDDEDVCMGCMPPEEE